MSMTYIQLIQQCTLAIWGGGVTLNFYPVVAFPSRIAAPAAVLSGTLLPFYVQFGRLL